MKLNYDRKVIFFYAIIFIVFISFSTVFVLIDPMHFVFQTQDDAAVPEIDNIIPSSFSERDMISNDSLSYISQIVLGANVSTSTLYTQISIELDQTIEKITLTDIETINDNDLEAIQNNSIIIGNSHVNRKVSTIVSEEDLNLPLNWDSQSFLIRGITNESTNERFVVIYGYDSLGDAYGVYWLINQILYGEEYSGDIFEINELKIPAVRLRMLDSNSAFLDPSTRFRKSPVEQIDLLDYPYFNLTRMDQAKIEFSSFLNYTLKTGYNTLQIGEFSHLVTFDDIIDGEIVENYEILGQDSPFRIRHNLYRQYFSEFFEEAEELGISTYVYTRIPYIPEPVVNYFGGLDSKNLDKIIDLYVRAIDEFFIRFPSVDGLQVMTGEVGGTHSTLDYFGATVITSKKDLTEMIESVLDVLDKHNKTMIYRIWSIGIGELGDLHRNPEQYDEVFNQFEEKDNLIISIKFQAGDYFRYLEFNPNIGHGTLPQMVEVSGTLEYSGMSLYPCYIAELFQELLQSLDNPPYAIWSWVTAGAAPKEEGFVGPFVIFLKRGFWSNIDVNINGFGKLGWEPKRDVNELTRTWVMKNFGYDQHSVENITKMLLLSDEMDYLGTYISDFAKLQPAHLGDLPTPVHWIYWDVPQSSSFALSPIYKACKEGRGIEANVQDGFQAAVIADEMISLLSSLIVENETLYNLWFLATEYGRKLFTMLANYRKCFLYFYDYSESLSKASKVEYLSALEELKNTKNDYINSFEDDYDSMFPLFDLSQLDRFIFNVENYMKSQNLSRISFSIVLFMIIGLISLSFIPERIRKKIPKPILGLNKIFLKPFESVIESAEEKNKNDYLIFAFFLFSIILQSLNLAVLNFLYLGWMLFYFNIIGGIIFLLIFSILLTAIMNLSSRNLLKIKFSRILKGTAISLAIPIFYSSLVLQFIFSIWGPQKIWLMWINPITLVFVIDIVLLVLIWKFTILVKIFSKKEKFSRLKSVLIILVSFLIPVTIILISLWIMGFNLWSNGVFQLHNVFNIFFSTMFERGPGASAWIPISVGQITIACIVICLILSTILVLVFNVKRKES